MSPTTIDVGLTVLALAGQTVPFVFTSSTDGRGWTAVHYLPVLLATLPVVWRRRAPIRCLLVTAAGVTTYSVVGDSGPDQPVWYGALIALYTVAEQAPPRRRLLALVFSAAGITVVGGVFGSVAAALREGLLWGAAYALGRTAQMRRAYAEMLAERTARLERDRELEVERAAEQQRAQIARDLHDVLAHAVSVMVVQAEAGPVAVRGDPARAEAAFDSISAAGRDAMVQLRRMLGLLTDHQHERAPQPTLDGLPDLLAGVGPHPQVSLTTSGVPRRLPPDVEVAAYRVVQEALTNVVKHTDAAIVTVSLDWADIELAVTITDDGSRAANAVKPDSLPGNGHGLVGIRERAAACGGSAWFGPAPGERGFQVSVRLPA